MRAAATVVMLIALAVPGYLAYQDPAQVRGSVDAITAKLDGSSDVQAAPAPQLMTVDHPGSQPREIAQALPSPPAPEATRESQSQPANTTVETPSPPAKAAGDAKAPQAAKSARQSATRSSASGSKQGSSKKVVKPKASDARARAKTSSARPTQPKERATASEK